jgi:hypothetical protein
VSRPATSHSAHGRPIMPCLGLTRLHPARTIRLANEVARPRQDLESMGFRSPVSQVGLDKNLWPLKLRSSKRPSIPPTPPNRSSPGACTLCCRAAVASVEDPRGLGRKTPRGVHMTSLHVQCSQGELDRMDGSLVPSFVDKRLHTCTAVKALGVSLFVCCHQSRLLPVFAGSVSTLHFLARKYI